MLPPQKRAQPLVTAAFRSKGLTLAAAAAPAHPKIAGVPPAPMLLPAPQPAGSSTAAPSSRPAGGPSAGGLSVGGLAKGRAFGPTLDLRAPEGLSLLLPRAASGQRSERSERSGGSTEGEASDGAASEASASGWGGGSTEGEWGGASSEGGSEESAGFSISFSSSRAARVLAAANSSAATLDSISAESSAKSSAPLASGLDARGRLYGDGVRGSGGGGDNDAGITAPAAHGTGLHPSESETTDLSPPKRPFAGGRSLWEVMGAKPGVAASVASSGTSRLDRKSVV